MRLAEADGLLGGPDARWDRSGASRPGNAAATRAVDFEFVVGMEDAALQLVGGEAEALFQRARIGDQPVDGADFAFPVLGFG